MDHIMPVLEKDLPSIFLETDMKNDGAEEKDITQCLHAATPT
jgi:hypothetical protein